MIGTNERTPRTLKSPSVKNDNQLQVINHTSNEGQTRLNFLMSVLFQEQAAHLCEHH